MISEKNYDFLTCRIIFNTPFAFSIHPLDFRGTCLLINNLWIIDCWFAGCGIQSVIFIETLEDTINLLFCQLYENLIRYLS